MWILLVQPHELRSDLRRLGRRHRAEPTGDAGMAFVVCGKVAGDPRKVAHVGGDETATFLCREGEQLLIGLAK